MNADDRELAPSLPHAQFLRIALDALSVRAVRWVSLVMGCGLTVACIVRPSWQGATATLGFMLLVNLPLWLRRGGG